jgi:hypothetical protein
MVRESRGRATRRIEWSQARVLDHNGRSRRIEWPEARVLDHNGRSRPRTSPA